MLSLTAVLLALVPQTPAPQSPPEPSSAFFHPGVRLESDGEPLQTGWFGHAAPALLDLDGDGDRDLLVGQYTDGVAQIHRNVGTATAPVYHRDGLLQAGGEDASVPTFCCVGLTPHLVDFDGDQVLDLLTGSYPGQLYRFPGLPGGKFGAREAIVDANGEPLVPGKATTAHAADIDNDGDLDLLSSLKKPGVAVAYNTGEAGDHRFERWEPLLVGGEPVPFQYAGPVIVDFDGDGILDLLIVRERQVPPESWRADVFFCRNASPKGRPEYQAPVAIIEDHPGLRLKLLPVDYNGDGLLDLLAGDMDANCAQEDYTGYVWFFRRKASAAMPPERDGPVELALGTTSSELVVTLDIDEHWHVYDSEPVDDGSVATSIVIEDVDGIAFHAPIYPAPTWVTRFGDRSSAYEGQVRIRVPFERAPATPPRTIRVVVEYQCCADEVHDSVCLMPRKRVLSVVIPG